MSAVWFPGVSQPVTRPITAPAAVPADAELEGEGDLTAVALTPVTSTAAMEGAGELSASGTVAPAVPLTYSAGLTGPIVRPITDGPIVTAGAADLAGTGTLAAVPKVEIQAEAALAGSGEMHGAGTSVPPLRLVIAVACGDNSMAHTTVAPSGWNVLSTVTASNGTDHTGDAVLAAAWTTTTASTVSATATSATAEDMSGMIMGVLTGAASPVPQGINPGWPYVIFEAAFGSGYQTPPDQMEWVNLQAWANGKRCRKWDETTGIQYELDALESSEVSLVLDNPDGFLSPENPSSPWYPYVIPGTPVRLRIVPPASAQADIWMVIQRNMERWPQSWDDCFRGIVNATGNDYWSVVARQLPTAYRAEVVTDAPYAWWPCDDPAVIPTPTSLVNAAPGNSAHLQIVTSPSGLSSTETGYPYAEGFTYSATEQFASNTGWMYGDPVSASWEQAGTGSAGYGRYLSCNDGNFPPLSGGITIEGWWNLPYFDTAADAAQANSPYTQPASTLILWEIASASGIIASLQVTSPAAPETGSPTGGYLQLVTYSGSTPAVHAIDSTRDYRNTTWFGVTVTLTQSSWQVWVNGGVVAAASGTASMASGWTWFFAGAGTGTSGGQPAASTITGMVNAAHSHLAVYPRVLPAGRIMAHYAGAYTGFGQLPAPAATGQFLENTGNAGLDVEYGPDGGVYAGEAFNYPAPGESDNALAAYACATGGGYTSAVSVPESVTIVPNQENGGFMWLTASVPAAPAITWYTAGGAGNEKLASTTAANYLYVDGYGSGAAPPSAPSALGDTVQERIERLLGAGKVTTPQRCIDAATAQCVAAIDTGGQPCGTAVSNIVTSDTGLLFVNNLGNLVYFSRPHLAAMTPAWVLGEDVNGGEIPYLSDVTFDTDPQQVKNDIAISQSSVQPDATQGTGNSTSTGAAEAVTTGLTFAPDATKYAEITQSQEQYGDKPYNITSYLQQTSELQAQANFLADVYSKANQRVTAVTVNAAPMSRTSPQSWLLVFGASVGDIFQINRRPPGQPSFSGTFRISQIKRHEWSSGTASVTLVGDVLPSYYPA